jgi:hypothetical protein
MREQSERQQAIRDLSMQLLISQSEDLDNLLDQSHNLRGNPNLAALAHPTNIARQQQFNALFSNESQFEDLISAILSHRYINPRSQITNRDEFDLARLFDMRDYDFKQASLAFCVF